MSKHTAFGVKGNRVFSISGFESLEGRIAQSATPVSADFSSAKNMVGMSHIRVDGVDLLRGSGFHIIGSKSGADNENNIASESPFTKNGVLRPYNGLALGGSLPYNFQFRTTADKSKIFFDISVGKSGDTFPALSFPVEANLSHFAYWRASNSGSFQRYDENPSSYPGAFISFSPASPAWAEMAGTKYTIRVGITSSSFQANAGFVNAPTLAGGIRDVEYGFQGLTAGQVKTVSGYIQVLRTDKTELPSTTFNAASSPYHQIGRKEADGWSVRVGDTTRLYAWYGPYVNVAATSGNAKGSSSLTAGTHTVAFKALIDNNSADDNRILTLEVFDSASGRVVKSLDVSRRMFAAANRFQDFAVEFEAVSGQRLEFREMWLGGAYVKVQSATFN